MATQSGRVSLRDVAEEVGVSRAAVSLVLNNGEIRIGDEKRAKILETARRLGYKPHIGARRLSLMRMETLSLIFPYAPSALSQLFLFELTRHLSEQARLRGYDIIIDFFHSSEPETLATDPGRVDGTILVSDRNTPGNIEHILDESGHPFIVVGGNYLLERPKNFVDFDIEQGTRDATQHLMDLGHKNFAFFAAVESPSKYSGFCKALKAGGLVVPDPVVLDSGLSESEIELGIDQLLALDPRPTAIVAANDILAIRSIKVFLRKGMDVPGDISLVGFDDIEPASLIFPSLTTVRIPLQKVAESLLSSLISMIESENLEPVQLVLPTKLIIRESSAPPSS